MLIFFFDFQALAETNSAHRKSLSETHTMGPKTHAVAKEKMVCVFFNFRLIFFVIELNWPHDNFNLL